MEHFDFSKEAIKFKNPEEEIAFLREQISQREKEIAEHSNKSLESVAKSEVVTKEAISAYKNVSSKDILHESHIARKEGDGIVLELSPENHDETISELLGILQAKGLKNVLDILAKMNDPHLEDDFERFIVQYIKAGFPVSGIKEKNPIVKALKMTLFEVSLPGKDPNDREKPLRELISSMEQFYAGMLSVSGGSEKNNQVDYFTIELAVANHGNEFIFHIGVPDSKKDLFEKHLLSVFHNAKITEKKDDYNIFSEGGVSLGSYLKLNKNNIYPIKTYEGFDLDPLNIVLNSFSKINKDGEGASIQIVLSPKNHYKNTSHYKNILAKVEKGEDLKNVLEENSKGRFFLSFLEFIMGIDNKKKEGDLKKNNDDTTIGEIKKKVNSPIVDVNIRILASSKTERDTDEILSSIESAFNQFTNTHGNSFISERMKKGDLKNLMHDFSFRIFNENHSIKLSLGELTTIMHMPATNMSSAPQLKTSKAGSAPAPMDLPSNGVLLGMNHNRGADTKIFLSPEDRLRHFYVIGQTGTGKTTILKNMIAQDIANGEGVCMIDPHGSDIQDILALIPPSRYEDVIYFDPSYTERPMALNMLEYDPRFPEQKTFVVNEMLSILNKLFDMKVAGGPMFEQYFRNATMLVIEDPESGNTLLEISRVLANKQFRELKLSKCKNPIVVQFWREVAEKAGGEASLANIVPYITSKFDVFLSNEIMRPIVAQEKSSFNFREIMDKKKILLVNLSKGRLGEVNANLLGLIIVGKILMAALSRVDSLGDKGENIPPFYLYIDEFQNITTSSISTILSEARKYKLSLNIAHQFIAQLEEGIKDSVFGNVGSMATFRVGGEDAEFLIKQYEPTFTVKDLMNVDNYNAYIKMLANGRPVKPFNIETMKSPKGNTAIVDKLKQLSYLKYGKDRKTVDGHIMAKYSK